MRKTITLTGDPKSTQTIYRSTARGGYSKVYMTAEGKGIKEGYQWEAKNQWRGSALLKGELRASIALYFRTKRRVDWDNFHKLSCDALSGIVYEDDSQIKYVQVFVLHDKARPRIEVTVGPLEISNEDLLRELGEPLQSAA